MISGGARSGKSDYAIKLAQELGEKVVYMATAEAIDSEMKARIARHKKNRPGGWSTVEVSQNLEDAFDKRQAAQVVLIDCLTLLANNLLMKEIYEVTGREPLVADENSTAIYNEPTSQESRLASLEMGNESSEIWDKSKKMERIENKILKYVDSFLKKIQEADCTVIIVTNELGLGIVPAYPLGRFYRDLIGAVNQKVAASSDEVYFMVSGIPIKIKGSN